VDRAAQRAKTKGTRAGYVYLHAAAGSQPPASRLHASVTNVMSPNS